MAPRSIILFLGVINLCLGLLDGHNIAFVKKNVVPGKVYNTTKDSEQKLYVYCYKGGQKHLLHIWQTAFFVVNLTATEYDLYKGTSLENVLQMYENHKMSWINQIFTWKSEKIDLDPFNVNCIGLDTEFDHSVVLNIIRIDLWRIVQLISGVIVFLTAPKLSSNPIFYYICGIVLGVSTSFLIAIYLLSKLIPKKPTVYALFIGGWAMGVYLFQILWENLKMIATVYYNQVLIYVGVTGLISFLVCYRFGPVTDPRSKNLIKWGMQTISLIFIFYSTRYQEISVLFILILLFYHTFPKKWLLQFLNIWTWKFPKKMKLLSEDEYHEEGVRETVRALEDLRKYCSSPECNQWKTILSLRKPVRFAQFMEGNSHLEDSELLAYESELQKVQPQLTDDSDTSEED